MYLLDTEKVPLKNFFNKTDVSCLLITMNIALTKFSHLDYYQKLPLELQQQFKSSFALRNRLFDRGGVGQWKQTELKGQLISCNRDCAFIFYALLFETWKCINFEAPLVTTNDHYQYIAINQETKNENDASDEEYISPTVESGSLFPRLLEYSNTFATHERYLSHNPEKVSNVDIRKFCRAATKNSVFVASSFGQKNCYHHNVGATVDIAEDSTVSAFAKLSTSIISETLHHNFNIKPFPDSMKNDIFFSHNDCPVVYGFDIAQEIQPMERNISLLVNGFSAKNYISQACEHVSTSADDVYPPAGTFCIFVFHET